MRTVALELCHGERWSVGIAGRLEAVAEVSVGRIDVEVEVRFGGHWWKCDLRDRVVRVNC